MQSCRENLLKGMYVHKKTFCFACINCQCCIVIMWSTGSRWCTHLGCQCDYDRRGGYICCQHVSDANSPSFVGYKYSQPNNHKFSNCYINCRNPGDIKPSFARCGYITHNHRNAI